MQLKNNMLFYIHIWTKNGGIRRSTSHRIQLVFTSDGLPPHVSISISRSLMVCLSLLRVWAHCRGSPPRNYAQHANRKCRKWALVRKNFEDTIIFLAQRNTEAYFMKRIRRFARLRKFVFQPSFSVSFARKLRYGKTWSRRTLWLYCLLDECTDDSTPT